ncbi:MAG TPA: hypothetical protein VHS31_08445, partial [Tepidisphaeraceae bacterium]|nr:hypothetical protein [Tepidisphaeraceae bacterium]
MQAKRNRRSMMLRALFVETLEGRQLLSAGGLDTSLGGDGIVSIPFNSVSAQGNAMAVQSDGKIVEVGRASDKHFLVARYNANGSPDTTFGSLGSGVVSVHVSDDDTTNIAYAVAIQTDGKIVVAGQAIHSINGGDPMIVCRFLSNGSLDHSFDDDGIVEINRFGGTIGPADYARGNAIAIQKDGKIIIAGDEEEGFTNPNDNLVMTRLNTDGSMDNKFGTFGEIDFDHDDNEVARAIAIDYNDTPATNPDYGKIVVVGHVSSNEETDIERGFADNNAAYKALIVRFTASGKLDTSFNKTGYIDGKIGGTGASVDAQAVAIEGDGYIVVAGSQGKNLGSSDHDFLVARFTPSGTRDTSFGGNGTVIVNMGGDDRATSVVIGGFGQQVIVGGTSGGSFALAAFNNNGLLDQSFGNKGKVLTFPDHGPSNVQLALAPNHTIVAAGGNDFNT